MFPLFIMLSRAAVLSVSPVRSILLLVGLVLLVIVAADVRETKIQKYLGYCVSCPVKVGIEGAFCGVKVGI